MKLHYLQHVPFEGPGIVKEWAANNGHDLGRTKLFKSNDLPEPESIDALVIMGGPMSIDDEDIYSWLSREKTFIKECIDQKIKVLGICLGAQLIADTLGAKVIQMSEKEIGWFPIHWTKKARHHPILGFLPAQQLVLHWHGDMFELPDDALGLAYSKGCSNQAFLIDDHVLGLQFHLEMTKHGLSELIDNGQDELNGSRFVQNARQMLENGSFQQNHKMMELILDQFFSA